jgi:hypothetical protein
MAIIASTQVLYDGTMNASVKAIGISDGGDGSNEASVTKVSVSNLIPVGGKIKILEIQYDVSYGAVTLSWDAETPVDFAHLDGFGTFKFPAGGLINGAGTGATGDILLTTRGFELNSTYSIILKMRKKNGHGPWSTNLNLGTG